MHYSRSPGYYPRSPTCSSKFAGTAFLERRGRGTYLLACIPQKLGNDPIFFSFISFISFLLMREPTHRLPTTGRPNAASLPEPAPAAENVTPAVAGRRQKRDRWMDGHGWMDGEREKSLTSSPPARSLTSDVRPIKKIFSPLLLYSVPLLFPSRQLHTP